jgi:hypothetical protein
VPLNPVDAWKVVKRGGEIRALDLLRAISDRNWLFSRRTRDLDDIRHAAKLVDVVEWRDRIARCTTPLRADTHLIEAARENWYILTGENDLPPVA